MNILKIFAIVFLFSFASRADYQAGNGVERGNIFFHGNESLPKGLVDRVQSLLFERCDLRDADSITTTYAAAQPNDAGNGTDYRLQYEVRFKNQLLSRIDVWATIFSAQTMTNPVKVTDLRSSICRSL